MSALPSGNKFVTGQFHRASNHVEVASDIGDSQEPIERPKAYSVRFDLLGHLLKLIIYSEIIAIESG